MFPETTPSDGSVSGERGAIQRAVSPDPKVSGDEAGVSGSVSIEKHSSHRGLSMSIVLPQAVF